MSGCRGWVLHRRPYRESSALVDLLLADRGRVRAVARGVHGHKSRLAQLLQPFTPLDLALTGRGELATLGRAESDGPPLLLTGEPLLCAFYLNELLLRLLPQEEECAALLAAYEQALAGLAAGEAVEQQLRPFELALLAHIGFAVDWQQDGHGYPVRAEQTYHFLPAEGWVAGGRPAQQVAGASLLAMVDEGSPHWWPAARHCLRLMLDALLGERPLQSRVLLRQQRQRSKR